MALLPRVFSLFPAVALALSLVAGPGTAQEAARAPHPWKLGYARKLAEEKLERRENAERRESARRKSARERRKALRSSGRGLRARPAPQAEQGAPTTSAPVEPRAVRRWNTSVVSPPTNVLVNDRASDVSAVSGQSETSITGVGDHLVAAWNDGEGFVSSGDTQGWATSTDGGLTWVDRGTFPRPPAPANFEWTSDPVLTVNEKSGAIYFAALWEHDPLTANWETGVAVVKGRWNGDTFTWGIPVILRKVSTPADFVDKPWIVADSVSGRVYLSYSRFPAGLSRIDFQWADSSLATFSSPQMISLNTDIENGWVQGSRPIVDGDGRLHVMYYLIGQFESDYYRVRTSVNNGVSFSPPITAVSLFTNFGTGAPGFNRDVGVQFASIGVDRSHGPNRNRVYLAWPESIDWLDDVQTIGQGGNKSEVEPNNTTGTATPTLIGQTLRGNVSSAGPDFDLYSLSLTAGEHVIIAADSTSARANIDVFTVRLMAGDGSTFLTYTTFDGTINPSAQNPNGIPSGWLFTAPADGIYYLRVDARIGSGTYRIRTGIADQTGERGRDQRDVFLASSDDGATWSTPVRINEDPVGFDNWLPEVTVAPDGGAYVAWYDFHDAPSSTNGGRSSVYLARSGDGGTTWTTLGAVTDALSAWPPNSSNIEPNQGDYIAIHANDSYVWPVWADMRFGNPDVMTGRVPLIPNGRLVAFDAVQLGPRRVDIDWSTSPPDTLTMRLYRSTDGAAFQFRDLLSFDGGGQASYADTTVVGDHGYSYRLGQFVNGVEIFSGQVTVFLPSSFPLSITPPRPNPVVGGSFGVSFSLATNDPAEIVLYDISGREVFRRDVSLGQGSHSLTLPVGPGLHHGMYVMSLQQGDRKSSTRFHLVR